MFEKSRKLLRPGLILFALAVIYFIFLIRSDYLGFLNLQREKSNLILALNRESEVLESTKKELAQLEGGELTEELARTKLGLVRKSEKAYKIVD